METVLKYDENDNLEYILRAKPGSLVTEEVWQITKVFYTEEQNIQRIGFANNDASFSFKASDYLFYKYSPPLVTIINPLENIRAGLILTFPNEDSRIHVIGENPELLSSSLAFNKSEAISFSYNNEQLQKGSQVIWGSTSLLIFNIPLIEGQSVVMRT